MSIVVHNLQPFETPGAAHVTCGTKCWPNAAMSFGCATIVRRLIVPAKNAWPIHKDLGRMELADIEQGLNWLKQQPWIDGERIGIWGWSYGGYMTAYAMTHSKSFKAGISGAPVTDWRNYDAIYTERYMGIPQNNEEGYDSSSVISAAENLHGKLLLIHGTQDDNVHIANTYQFVYALQNAGKQFELMVYPKNRHGVREQAQQLHMYKMMTRFLLKNL